MRTAARIVAAIGAVLVALAAFGTWTTHGVGSAINGQELADLLLTGTVDTWVPRWVGGVFYLIPLAGACVLLGLGLGGRVGGTVIVVAGTVAVVVSSLVVAALDGRPLSQPGSGARCLWAGMVLWLIAVVLVGTAQFTARRTGRTAA